MEPDNAGAAEPEERSLPRARFIDRFVAFSLDYFLVLLLSYVGLFAAARALGPGVGNSPPVLLGWLVLWLSAFLAYHAFFSSNERTTVGKKLLGIQVFTQEGYPLPLRTAALRSLSYLASSFIFGLGFLWSLFSAKGLCWHDSLTGTMVLETRPKTGLAKVGIAIAALFFFAAEASLVLWPMIASSYHQMEILANARESLGAMARLEETYKARAGVFTGDLNELGKVYGDPREFITLLGQGVDLKTMQIEAGKDHYRIQAKALDENATPYEISGPRPGG